MITGTDPLPAGAPFRHGRIGRRPRQAADDDDGWPSAAWPCSNEAAAAISSAKPMMLTSRMRPNRSG